MNEHIVRSYGDELKQLTSDVTRLGGLAEAQVSDALDALSRRDVALAKSVVARDQKLDDLQAEIERATFRLIALRQPMAVDLRHAVAALKLSMTLERCGDLAKNIAKRSLVLADAEPLTPFSRSMDRMGRLVLTRLKEVLDAYSASDVERAVTVWSRDEEVDEHYNSLFRELLTYMMSDPRTIGASAHLLFIAKNLERIGDYATNIAEVIHFELTGEEIASKRPKLETVPT